MGNIGNTQCSEGKGNKCKFQFYYSPIQTKKQKRAYHKILRFQFYYSPIQTIHEGAAPLAVTGISILL